MDLVRQHATAIAGAFLAARRRAEGLTEFPGVLPVTLDEAYAIQDRAIADWGEPILGWKVGRVLPPLSGQYGTDRLAGPIFRVTTAGKGAPAMPIFSKGFAAAEAEFLLRVGAAPESGKTTFTLADAADLIDRVHVGIEIASSPLASINDLGPTAVVSDFGNNNGLVVGPEVTGWRDSGLEQWQVAVQVDGRPVGSGRAAAFSDGTLGSARFLFELLARRGITPLPGQWISSGAITGVHAVTPGQRIDADFGDGLALGCTVVAA